MGAVTLSNNREDILRIYEFIRSQNLNYPQYEEWAKKCRDELLTGYKKAFVIKNKNGKLIGSLIVQKHKSDSSVLEMKNARIASGYENKGHFKQLYLAAERYAREKNYKKIVCDSHMENFKMISSLHKVGFIIESKENIYTPKNLEVILTKDLTTTNIRSLESSIIESYNKFINRLKLLFEEFFAIRL
ncbi:MAG TPA: GNAT family N-acetyltransferase [Alphaproteobacteria bacterium]|nr:GNAT family N-acetyltransferase [Alphaproteobacteria bacterium]